MLYAIAGSPQPPEGGNVAGGGTYASGEQATVTALPVGSYTFRNWTEDGVEVSTSASFSFTVRGNRSLIAHFIRLQYSLTVTASGAGEGTITSSPSGVQCVASAGNTAGACAAAFDRATSVALTAAPAAGHSFVGWSGACSGTGICSVAMNSNLTVTARFDHASASTVGYLAPADVTNGRFVIDVPASPSGETYIVAVPNLSSADWWNRSQYLHDQLIRFAISTSPAPPAQPTPLRALPQAQRPVRHEWGKPASGPAGALLQGRIFHIWSQTEQRYIPVPGRLAFTGNTHAFYEDTANIVRFTTSEWQALNSVMEGELGRLYRLMGSPTDLDGNERVIVFVSRTMMQHRSSGEAYVDGCHLRVTLTGCVDRGEFVYIASLDHFNPTPTNRQFYVTNYYPRNILHETTHILQQSHAYRRSGSWASFSVPAYYGEGQAELMSTISGLRLDELWASLKRRFVEPNQTQQNPWFYPYDLGALFYWYVHQSYGEGVSQAIIDTAYDSRRTSLGITHLAFGIAEPLVLATMYSSLVFDGTAFGTRHGLHFPDEEVSARLSGTPLPVTLVAEGGTAAVDRSFTGAAIFRLVHSRALRIQLEVSPELAYVVVAQPDLR